MGSHFDSDVVWAIEKDGMSQIIFVGLRMIRKPMPTKSSVVLKTWAAKQFVLSSIPSSLKSSSGSQTYRQCSVLYGPLR
jgi:hypothetical protein